MQLQQYPEILLPKRKYKLKISLPASKLAELFLIRRSLVKKEETTNSLGTVRSDAFIEDGKEHFFYSLSCNLLGIFTPDHIIFLLGREEGRKLWNDKAKLKPASDVDFSIDTDTCAIYLNVSKINDKPHPYQKKKHDGKVQQYVGRCQVVHTPLEANYWHFEIKVIDQETATPIPTNQKDWKPLAVRNFFESYLKLHLSVDEVTSTLEDELFIDDEEANHE